MKVFFPLRLSRARPSFYAPALATAIFLFLSCQSVLAQEPLKKVSFIPLWKPQAQFAGYFVACEKGIYQKYGLEVTILPGGPDYPPNELLDKGKADFGVMWLAAGIRARSQGSDVVNIAQIVQRSALMFVARKSSGILKPEDMAGKKISLWEGYLQLQPKAFLRKFGLEAKTIPQSYAVNLFLAGGVDVASAMWYNEYNTIINSGINEDELSTFFFSDYGLNFPEDGIYVRGAILRQDPRLAEAFVKASIEGWLYAFRHKEEAVDIVLKYMREAYIPANRTHQKWMLSRMEDIILVRDAKHSPGELNKDDFNRVSEELIRDSLIQSAPDFKEFYYPVKAQ